MLRSLAILALAGAATAASWPMVSVNSAGDIVLGSITRAQSLQFTPTTVTAAPSSGTASLSTVTSLFADVDTYKVSVPSSIGTDGGFKLPEPTLGRTITLFNDGTGAGAYTVWTSSTGVLFNSGTATTYSVGATASSVTFTATSTTNWLVTRNGAAASTKTAINVDTTSTNTAAATLTAAMLMNGFYQFAGTSTAAITTPTGTVIEAALANPSINDSFEFTLHASSTAGATLTAAASGVTITAAEAYVAAGTRKTFIIYRTAASTYTFLLKSTAGIQTGVGLGNYATTTATATLTEAQHGLYLYATTAVTLTTPTCSSANLGLTYTFIQGGAAATTIATASTDFTTGWVVTGADGTIGGRGTTISFSIVLTSAAAVAAGTTNAGAYMQLICIAAGVWMSPYAIGEALPEFITAT
jgi:hypothetical protein